MKNYFFALLFFTFLAQITSAQNQSDKEYILQNTNVDILKKLSDNFNSTYEAQLESARKRGIDSIYIYKNGQIGFLSGFDLNGEPVYDLDDNLDAAITNRVDKIWDGGSSGLNLDGDGVTIGQWETGIALLNHQELDGKISHGDIGTVKSHATRMACTMVGTGVDNKARGMASGASIISRNTSNDESEISSFAAFGGILSNHSYSTGNPDGDVPRYGHYNYNSSEWDFILYNAPYLTLCKSAGNQRNDGVNIGDNGYDILFTVACSKNLITVGAVNDIMEYSGPESVVQSSFSSWGPTDDWRIKPDLVANGVGVYSGNNESPTSYSTGNGTSQACATVSGAVALLHEHYQNVTGEYMKAATVKALLLSTTDEAGDHEGPDFQNGYGIINAERAANVISNQGETSSISELTLINGNEYNTTIETDGLSPISIMIAWTDPAGTPNTLITDDLTPMLVNDLDIRLMNDTIVYEPWTMVPGVNNFNAPASRGDNFRDNAECIKVSDIPAGTYTINVSHKGDLLFGRQDFSLVINGMLGNSTSSEETEINQKNISVFPNPSQDGIFTISLPNDYKSGPYDIQVYDGIGNLVTSEFCYQSEHILDLSMMHTGTYILTISQGKTTYSEKIQIVR